MVVTVTNLKFSQRGASLALEMSNEHNTGLRDLQLVFISSHWDAKARR